MSPLSSRSRSELLLSFHRSVWLVIASSVRIAASHSFSAARKMFVFSPPRSSSLASS